MPSNCQLVQLVFYTKYQLNSNREEQFLSKNKLTKREWAKLIRCSQLSSGFKQGNLSTIVS